MSAEDLSAEDLREYERINAWIYDARERLYEQTKDMSPQEITAYFDRRAELIRQEFAQHELKQADTVLVRARRAYRRSSSNAEISPSHVAPKLARREIWTDGNKCNKC